MAGESELTRKAPSSPEVTDWELPVAGLIMTTLAPETPRKTGSRTVPSMAPVSSDCPQAEAAEEAFRSGHVGSPGNERAPA